MPEHVHTLDPTADNLDNDAHPAVYPSGPPSIARVQRADFLPDFTRAVGREVILDRRQRTSQASIFGGPKPMKTHACTVLLDNGSPATFIKIQVWELPIACGAASSDGLSKIPERKWGDFHGNPLVTTSRGRKYVPIGGAGGLVADFTRAQTVRLAVHAHVAPDEAMRHAVLLGWDSWADYPVPHEVDIIHSKTVVTFT